MQMSAAALPPIHGHVADADRQHPRFAEYQKYRSGCSNLLIRAEGFKDWLSCREAEERRDRLAEHPRFTEYQQWMCATKAGRRRCPAGGLPESFQFWLGGGRW